MFLFKEKALDNLKAKKEEFSSFIVRNKKELQSHNGPAFNLFFFNKIVLLIIK